ncbi:MAG: DUF475 domain-containing protein [Spirochaetales bacterium]
MKNYFRHFTGSTVFALLALATAFWLGWQTGGAAAGLSLAFTALMLGVLETSLSFDNAVVNARVLATMSPFWRKMFLTLGMIIAVFGMRIVFPLVLVWLVSALPFLDVVRMTWEDPHKFQEILVHQHLIIAGFGGAFLWMVFAKFFFDADKAVHWIPGLEKFLARLGHMEAVWVLFTLGLALVVHELMPALHRPEFLFAAVIGVVTFLALEGLGSLMNNPKLASSGGLGAFLYLEVLDASFSMDGVIGAFAITDNLFIIALGLGIGAFFVRSMTIKLVDDKTLGAFRYLEHGAFWAIGALALIMFLGALDIEVHEVIAGTVGLVIIGLSFGASVLHNRRNKG